MEDNPEAMKVHLGTIVTQSGAMEAHPVTTAEARSKAKKGSPWSCRGIIKLKRLNLEPWQLTMDV
jgi:hypothetical protein